MCHCLECQRRTGAVVSNQARFPREQIAFAGTATEYTRSAASGNTLTFRFCPRAAPPSTGRAQGFPGLVAVAIGTLADPNLPRPDRVGMGGLPPPLAPAARRPGDEARSEAGLNCHPGTRAARIRDPGPLAPPLAAPRANVIPAPLGREAHERELAGTPGHWATRG